MVATCHISVAGSVVSFHEPVVVKYGVLIYIISLPDQRWEIRVYFRVFYLWLELIPEIVLSSPFVPMREKGKGSFRLCKLIVAFFQLHLTH